MSFQVKDQDVIENGRKPLKDVDAPLRDQLQSKLFKKLVDLEVGSTVSKIWTVGNADRQEWLERQQIYLADLDEFANSSAEGPFEGSSNLHVPMPLTVVKAMHARFLQALLGMDPPFTTKARKEGFSDFVPAVQDTMRYAINSWANANEGIAAEVDAWIWSWITSGLGYLKQRWDSQYERFTDVQEVVEAAPPEHSVDDQGNEVVKPKVRSVEKEIETVVNIVNGPALEWIPNEDVLMVGGRGSTQKADSIHLRQWITASELWTLADRKVFDANVVEEIIESGEDRISGQIGSDIKNNKAVNSGKTVLDSETDLDRYELSESYLALDVDGSGINTQVVVWVHLKSKKLVGANYLRRMNRSGLRPIQRIEFLPRPGAEYPIGLLEMLHPLSVEIDAFHNMRIDFGIMSNMPFFFYRPSSNIDPKVMQLEPGAGIPVDNPQTDIYFPTLSNRTAFGFQEEQALTTLVEKLTSMSDLNYGSYSGGQGATRTATGVQGVLGEANANLDVFLQRLRRGWTQALKYMFYSLQQRIPEGLSFRVTGDNGADYWRTVRKGDFQGDVDFEISANSADSNPQIMAQKAQQIFQTAMNPLLLQTGIVSMGNLYESAKNFYKSSGIKDYGRYLTAPPDYQMSRTPNEELLLVLHGMPVPVVPQMDHQGFITYVQTVMASDELAGSFTQDQAKMIAAQLQKHVQMQQAIQQQQAQAANVAQQRQASANPQQQAQPGAAPGAGPAPVAPPQGAQGGELPQ